MSWENWDVRVYAAEAWVSLAAKFASERPEIVDRIGDILMDHNPAVRLQAAKNLQVIALADPERMWEMGERIATTETNAQVLIAYLGHPLRRFSHEPERCEHILAIAKGRLDDFVGDLDGREHILRCLGGWVAQLQARQGRPLARNWLDAWAADPVRFQHALKAYTSWLQGAFFFRYAADAEQADRVINDRAQEGLAKILAQALDISAKTHAVLTSGAPDKDKRVVAQEYLAAEKVIRHAMNQLYFGAGGYVGGKESYLRLNCAVTKKRFLDDYAEILTFLRRSRDPKTLHHLIQLYEYLIPGDPITVFMAIYAILTGPGAEEGYQYESLGNAAVVKVVRRYIADNRGIFEDPERRAKLVEILQLFSEVGWPEAIKLLYEMPDLLR